MAQQTAVEWFHEKTWELKMLLEKQQISIDEYGIAYYDILEEAKEMEKQQMIDFANDLLAQNNTNYIAIPDLAEQYYTETYGNNTKNK
jgi:hypothetical protein